MIETHNRFATFIPPENATCLIGDFTDWDEKPIPITKPLTLEFPQGAYVEYAFLDDKMRPIADTANPHKPSFPWYDYHRCFTLPHNGFTTPPRSHMLRGTLNQYSIDSHALEGQRTCYVYDPPVSPVATLYVHDGEGYYRLLRFHQIADALIEQEFIQPIRLVMIKPRNRTEEYWFNERYEAFLLEEMMPEIHRQYGQTSEQGLWGASLGGMVSAWLAWRNPAIFSTVASQSGCFTADPQGGNYYHDPEWLTEQFAQSPSRPLRFFLQTGQIEWLLAPNRRFAAVLADKGYTHSYQEVPGGHNWTTWEQGVAPGLVYLFGSGV